MNNDSKFYQLFAMTFYVSNQTLINLVMKDANAKQETFNRQPHVIFNSLHWLVAQGPAVCENND